MRQVRSNPRVRNPPASPVRHPSARTGRKVSHCARIRRSRSHVLSSARAKQLAAAHFATARLLARRHPRGDGVESRPTSSKLHPDRYRGRGMARPRLSPAAANRHALPDGLTQHHLIFWRNEHMTIATNLGFSRMGRHRELKKALERFWAKKCDAPELLSIARAARPTGSSSKRPGSPRSRATTSLCTTRSSTRR